MQTEENADIKLFEAIKQNQPHVIRQLIRNGAVVNARNHLGDTPLHLAALCGRDSIVQMLLDAGANPKVKNTAGLSPSAVAGNAGHWHIADNIRAATDKQHQVTRRSDLPQIGG